MAQIIAYHFVALLVILDPLGVAAIFSGLTNGLPVAEKHRIARRAVTIAALTLLVFAFAGDQLLKALGIGLPAFRIAGGVLLFLIAVDMVFAHRFGLKTLTATENRDANQRDDITVFPLAIPLIAGPGALTTMVLLMGKANGDLPTQVSLIGVLIVVLALTLVLMRMAGRLMRLLGDTGVTVVSRILGILVAALAVQLVLDGLNEGLKFGA